MLFALVCERGIRPRLEEVRPEVKAAGLTGPMWQVVENCWRQVPKERWTANRLCEELEALISWMPPRTHAFSDGSLYKPRGLAPTVVHAVSASSSFTTPHSTIHPLVFYTPGVEDALESPPNSGPSHLLGLTKDSEDSNDVISLFATEQEAAKKNLLHPDLVNLHPHRNVNQLHPDLVGLKWDTGESPKP